MSEERTLRQKLIDNALEELEFDLVLKRISRFCYSQPGTEWIMAMRPSDDVYWLNREHDLIEEMIIVLTEDDNIPFEGFKNIKAILHKTLVSGAVLNTAEIILVQETIRVSRMIKNYFLTRRDKYPTIAEETDRLHFNRMLEKHIDEAIDETGEIRDNATSELFRIRKDIISKSNRLRSRLQKILKHVSEEEMVQEEYITLREGRYVLPVKAENKRKIPGIIHGISQTGSTVFLEPSEIFEMNNDLSLLMNEEKREIYRILSNLTEEIGRDARQFLLSIDNIVHIDAILAKSQYALKYGGIKPAVTEDNEISLVKIKHPVLVQQKDAKEVIPLTVEFSENSRGHLISGPNAGGKTVALKSIGLNITMALSGIFPLGSCTTNYRAIFSSIGDHQSIENDFSTFSAQMYQLKQILDESDNRSLVLIDEIGSGTDPQEGGALASGILDTFIELNAYFVATTHQSSLKSYALSRDVIENASLEFDEKELKPTYKFLRGIPGNSYAFVLAESIGLNKLVLERSRKYLGTKENQLEKSITILQKYKNEAEQYKREALREKQKAEHLRTKYEEKVEKMNTQRNKYLDQAREEAGEIVSKANALVENTIREIKEEKRSISEIKQDYTKEKKEIHKQIEKKKQPTKQTEKLIYLEEGDSVGMIDSESVGTVIEADNDSKSALVDFNGVKFRLPYDQLVEKTRREKRKSLHTENISMDVVSRIDLRGKRAFEALADIDEFLNQAVMGNVDNLTIIHGKGTGALRKAIHEYLSTQSMVKSYRNGTLVEGGDGVTIVEM
jgi:DNA mismatch repair protein MutS2